jgi:hypothetical protein
MENPATDEVSLVIQFLKTKDFCPVEIHRQIVEVCVEGKMNEGYVRKWYWLCKKARQRATACRNACYANSSRRSFSSIFSTVPTLRQVILTCFSSSRNILDENIQKIFSRYEQSINLQGDCVEK